MKKLSSFLNVGIVLFGLINAAAIIIIKSEASVINPENQVESYQDNFGYCVAAKQHFQGYMEDKLIEFYGYLSRVDAMEPTEEYSERWWMEHKLHMRYQYENAFKIDISDDPEYQVLFEQWYAQHIEEAGGKRQMKQKIITAQYQDLIRKHVEIDIGIAKSELEKEYSTIEEECESQTIIQIANAEDMLH